MKFILFFKKYILKKKLNYDSIYIFKINNEYSNDLKYKIIWTLSRKKDLLNKFKIK